MPKELSPEELLRRLKHASAHDKKGVESIIIACSTKIKNARGVPPEKAGQWESWAELPQELFSKLREEQNLDNGNGAFRRSKRSQAKSDRAYFSEIEAIAATRWETPEQDVRELIAWATARLYKQASFPSPKEERTYQKWSYVLLEIFRNLIYDRR